MTTFTALSVRQPWAGAIILGNKDVENRSRAFHYRGPLLIHAGVHVDPRAFADPRIKPLGFLRATVITGHIVGYVRVIDCVRDSKSPWAARDQFHILLRDAGRFLRPIPYKGQLNRFQVPRHLVIDQLPGWFTVQRELPL